MRQSRRLALILAAQLGGLLPVIAYAQPAPTGRPAAADLGDDDDGDEPVPAAVPAQGTSGTTTEARPEEPAPAGTPESDEDRRTRLLPRYSTLDGSIGLIHTTSAQTGSAGSFRFGLMTEYFGGSTFLRPLDSLHSAGTTATAGTGGDSSSHIGSTLTLSYSPLDFLEIYAGVRAYANSDSPGQQPALFQVLGDTDLGLKAGFRLTRGFYLGGDVAAYLLNRSGDIGLLLDSTSFNLRANATLDLHELTGTVPMRIHFNIQYYFDNSASLVSDTEARRRAAQPGYSAARCADPASANDPTCHLEITRVERYALGINRVDQLGINLGADLDLPIVRHVFELNPFVEWHVGIPVNRQSYQCFDPGTSGMRPGGVMDDDQCLANTGFASIPSRLTIGTRVLPPIRGLALTAAFDIATSGTNDFVRELTPTPPWMFYLGAGFAYDIHPVEHRIEVPGPERIVSHDVDRTPPGGHVLGHVRDAEAHTPVANAIVTFTGHPDLPIVASAADGTFRTGHLSPGEYRLHVVAPEFTSGDCTVTVTAGQTAAAPAPGTAPGAGGMGTPAAPGTPGAGAGEPAPSEPGVETEATVTCDLRAVPRRGGIAGRVVSSQGNAGVAGVTVVAEPAPGLAVPSGQAAPAPQNATTDGEGRFTFHDMLAGPYSVTAQASEQHMAAMPRSVTVEPRTDARAELVVTRRPAHASVAIRGNLLTIARQIHFQTNSTEILPDSNTLVEEIADVLNHHPEISQVEIEGHTDNQGTPPANLTLSQGRADSVRSALTRLGVPGDRLVAHGFGQTRPIRPNLTAAGRAANRRVEFHLTRTATPPAAAPTRPGAGAGAGAAPHPAGAAPGAVPAPGAGALPARGSVRPGTAHPGTPAAVP